MTSRSPENVLDIRLFGTFKVSVNGRLVPEDGWQRDQAKLLVKHLALNPRCLLSRDQLLELMWPDLSPKLAANNLSKAIYMARRALEPDLTSGNHSRFIYRKGSSISLNIDGQIQIDTQLFEKCAKKALAGVDPELCETALAYSVGELLEEDRYTDTFAAARQRYTELKKSLLSKLIELSEKNRNWKKAIECGSQLLNLEPGCEQYHRRLMQHYAYSGDRSKALAQYQVCVQAIADAFDTVPDTQTRELFEKIKQGDLRVSSKEIVTNLDKTSSTSTTALAVMPFRMDVHTRDTDYLLQGITEHLIVELSHYSYLSAIAPSTIFHYQSRLLENNLSLHDPVEIGRDLRVDLVLIGTIKQHDTSLSISVELVYTGTGSLKWAKRYRINHAEISTLTYTLSRSICAEIQPSSYRDDVHSRQLRTTTDASAFHEYLKGRYHWNKRTGVSLAAALNHFQRAIDLDPVYALAYSGLADTYNLLGLYTDRLPGSCMPKARAAAKRAIEISPNLAEAHASLAYCQLSYDWNLPGAEASFQKALEINPGYATAHQWYHKLLVCMGRFEEARSRIKQAKNLDPLSLMIDVEECWGLYHSRQFDQAEHLILSVLADNQNYPMARYISGLVRLQLDNVTGAIADLESTISQQSRDRPFVLAIGVLGYAYVRADRDDLAALQLARLSDQSSDSVFLAYARSLIHTASNEHELALRDLQTAASERFDRMLFLAVEPLFDPLREHDRFKALLNTVKCTAITAKDPSSPNFSNIKSLSETHF